MTSDGARHAGKRDGLGLGASGSYQNTCFALREARGGASPGWRAFTSATFLLELGVLVVRRAR